jgi:glycyl-tRNA synthetase
VEKIVNLAKQRGFVYPGSEIYGGLSNTWDYGPIGVLLKNNIKKAWWHKFVTESDLNVGIDSAILMNKKIWEASGHLENFSDPLIDCKDCKARFRADDLIDEFIKENPDDSYTDLKPDAMSNEELEYFILKHNIVCPKCGKNNWTKIRKFNLMFKTYQGVTDDSKNEIFLRPETAQGIFVNFKNVQRATRKKLPFGIAQIGKAFRNEITPGNFIFRTREFEQMELEFFCRPEEDLEWFSYWKKFAMDFLLSIGLKNELLKYKDHAKEELSHYSVATTDIIFNFPFGWGELWGIADRTDFDLKKHMEESGEDLTFFDELKKEKFIPYCIEPSLGVDRLMLAALVSAYEEEKLENEVRRILHLHPLLAPYKVAILPLSKKLSVPAKKIHKDLSFYFSADFDDTGSIGKRYRREDEIGTPFCITYDFDSNDDNMVTVRDRDTMKQKRIPIADIKNMLLDKLSFN